MTKKNAAPEITTTATAASKGGVEAVDRALSIIKCFGAGEDRLTLAQIAERTGYYKSTILRLAVSLERQGFLSRSSDKSFMLGSQLLRLGNLYQRSLKLEDQVRPSLMNLLQETGESASLFIRQGEDRICLFRQDSDHAVRDHVSEGQILSLDRGAAGHVISKFDPDYNSEADIRPRVADLPVFSFGERVAEVAAAAVPVFWLHEGRVKLTDALTVSGPLSRFTDDACKIMRAALLKEGQQLSARLGAEYIWK